MKAITAYDHYMKALAVQYKDETGYQMTAEFHDRIAFSNPRVVVTLGSRDGCVKTGFLGYVEGEAHSDQQAAMIPFNQAVAIRWNGEQFVDDTDKHISGMAEVYIVGKTMLGIGVQYGTVKAVQAIDFNPDAYGLKRRENLALSR